MPVQSVNPFLAHNPGAKAIEFENHVQVVQLYGEDHVPLSKLLGLDGTLVQLRAMRLKGTNRYWKA